MKSRFFKALILSLVILPIFAGTVQAQAPNPNNVDIIQPICRDVDGNPITGDRRPEICDSSQNKSDEADSNSPITGPNGVLSRVMDILALVVGIACVIVIIISGLRFVVSAGDSNAISSARRSLLYAVVGLVIVVAARTLVRWILGRI